MGSIFEMPTKLANMISAGEVVERPLNIVKEVVENSIDAKSSDIKIYLKDGGLTSVKVVDNGTGMDRDDIKLCFLRYATSKIRNEYDLFRINTLGFRGEALASIASVSEVSLTSKCESDKAYNIIYKYGRLVSFEESVRDIGTTIEIKNLFYNTPARLKYLKSKEQELASISQLVDKLAISKPNISFSLFNDDKLIYRSAGNDDLFSLVGSIYGLEASKRLTVLPFNEEGLSGKLLYVKPEIYRSNKNQMTYIINNRYVRYFKLNEVIIEAFKGYLPIGKYPIVILYLNIDPLLIDVNIHPKKEEIKIAEPEILFDLVTKLIKEDLTKVNHIVRPLEIKEDIKETYTLGENVATYNQIPTYKFSEPTNKLVEEETKKLPKLTYLTTFLKTYLICQNEETMYLVDQHAAAERIKYEYYSKELNNPKPLTTSFIVPYTLEMTKEEIIYLEETQKEFNKLGFKYNIKDNKVDIIEVPLWSSDEVEDNFREILDYLMDNKKIDILAFRDEICKQISCKASIRAHDYINELEINNLLNELAKCDNPWHCPHGRPTIIALTKKDLEKLFERTN